MSYAYNQGYDACKNNLLTTDNPYPLYSWDWHDWLEGYEYARYTWEYI